MLKEREVTPRNTVVSQLLIFVGCFLIGLIIGQLLAVYSLMPFYTDLTLKGLQNFIQHPPENWSGRFALLMLQGVSSLVTFIIVPLLFLRFLERKSFGSLNERPGTALNLMLTIVVVLAIMPFMSIIISWNANMQFPGFLADFERFAKTSEENLAKLTAFLVNMESGGEFLFTLFVIAVIPGIGEELVFRGLIQKKFTQLMNPHIAIWLSAFLFSAFHLQFYGLVPRMLLGALFGYLYYWSGNLWLPILAHFINNGFTLLMIYLFKSGVVSFDIQKIQYGIPWIIVSILGTGAIMWLFYQKAFSPPKASNETLEYIEEQNI